MKKWTRRELLPLIGAGLAGSAFVASSFKEDGTETKEQLIEIPLYARPSRLKKGDTIGICTPAGALRRNEEVAEFTKVLNQMGFEVKVGENVYKKHGYFAGTDEERASDFMNFIQDETVRGIFFLRGGWGCARILPLLDFDLIRKHKKVIMGFSDLTSLLNAITEHSGIVTFHGPGGNSSWNEYSIDYIRKTTMGNELTNFRNTGADHPIITYSSGTAFGTLWGGNLSVLVSMIGTPYFPKIKDGLLFLEEVGEEPYRIDRMLTQLKQAGILDRCKGVILGNFRKCTAEEPHRAFTLEEVFEQHFRDIEKPVYYGAQIGHTVNKFTVPIGIDARMDADKGTFQLTSSAVK
ncbi:MAG: LD-carboxypeptidase [bacterium]|nr:LD-carboxypeptidase [bacterium]